MKWISVAAGFCLLWTSTAMAGFKSSGDVYSSLQAYDRNPSNGDGIMALGYIVGIADKMIEDGNLCIPDGTKVGQVTQVAQNFLGQHPETWQQNSSTDIEKSLMTAWPCPWKKY